MKPLLIMDTNAERTKLLIEFGLYVRSLRQNKHMNQEELAERCHLDRTYISGIERGKRNVSLVNLQRISKALEIPMSDLMKFQDGDHEDG